ncbi:hypothetical protein SAMN05444166_6292 [Singulisphaera sp. GP187]|uniref:hypothetical protein n=1 Tax=Singulisphaera sp. GP187 TaxID=1882752 RepID=UPI000928C150|nr:hypothetical protein [Singulisphaera sp. GP187]SIO60169.1 hypothetical protein SAMN05444166_6292 [Singulisphaera sp. GP187]
MPTTKSNFVKLAVAALVGAAMKAAGAIGVYAPEAAAVIESGGGGSRLDYVLTDLSASNYAKNGAATVALTGTTAVTIDLTDLTSATASSAGDTTFATVNKLVLRNTGTASLTVAPGGSNPFDVFLGGSSPTLTIPAGSTHVLESVAGKTVDSTHKTILITPAATGSFAICAGGA